VPAGDPGVKLNYCLVAERGVWRRSAAIALLLLLIRRLVAHNRLGDEAITSTDCDEPALNNLSRDVDIRAHNTRWRTNWPIRSGLVSGHLLTFSLSAKIIPSL